MSHKLINEQSIPVIKRPKRVLQFGEGNFLRAFVDFIFDCSNEAGVTDANITIIKPIDRGNLDRFTRQDNLYTVILRGVEDGQTVITNRVVTCIEEAIDPFSEFEKYQALMLNPDYRYIVSNTTEAGIAFNASDKLTDDLPSGFPGKVTKLLLQRYTHFNGAQDKGFIFLPVELIEKNGDQLLKCVMQYIDLWQLSEAFKAWVLSANVFCNTLVDRIVSGYPKAEEDKIWDSLGYHDDLMVTGEPFGFWAIGSSRIKEIEKELKFESNVKVILAEDIEPYKQRKVRILNGAHTSMVLGAYNYGLDTVDACMHDEVIRSYMVTCIFDEIVPTIDLDADELNYFANKVYQRFQNPFLNHKLLDISLNSTSKWRARVLPTVLDYNNLKKELPRLLTFSFAAYMAFYMGVEEKDGAYFGNRENKPYPVRDDAYVLETYEKIASLKIAEQVKMIMTDMKLWGMDLTTLDGFEAAVVGYLTDINTKGIKQVMTDLMSEEVKG